MRGYHHCEYSYEVGEPHGAVSFGFRREEWDWTDYPARSFLYQFVALLLENYHVK